MKTPKTKASTPRPPVFQVALIGELSILNKTLKALLAEERSWHTMIEESLMEPAPYSNSRTPRRNLRVVDVGRE